MATSRGRPQHTHELANIRVVVRVREGLTVATQGSIDKAPSLPARAASGRSDSERRSSRRCKITQVMRVRPSDPERDNFDDIRGSASVSRSGVYFRTDLTSYELGMRLFVTLPYCNDPVTISREYLAEVVRLERLVTGNIGVGLKLLMEIGFQQNFIEAASCPRK